MAATRRNGATRTEEAAPAAAGIPLAEVTGGPDGAASVGDLVLAPFEPSEPDPANGGPAASCGMSPALVAFLSVWHVAIGALSLVTFLWIYQRAEQDGTSLVQWFGPDFHLSPNAATLLATSLAAVMGSVVQTGTVFTLRAGYGTLESSYKAWYLLRPVIAALLGTLLALALLGGLFVVSTDAGDAASRLAGFVSMGALAGLFTDRVLQMMQRILGATEASIKGSDQPAPGSPSTADEAVVVATNVGS